MWYSLPVLPRERDQVYDAWYCQFRANRRVITKLQRVVASVRAFGIAERQVAVGHVIAPAVHLVDRDHAAIVSGPRFAVRTGILQGGPGPVLDAIVDPPDEIGEAPPDVLRLDGRVGTESTLDARDPLIHV